MHFLALLFEWFALGHPYFNRWIFVTLNGVLSTVCSNMHTPFLLFWAWDYLFLRFNNQWTSIQMCNFPFDRAHRMTDSQSCITIHKWQSESFNHRLNLTFLNSWFGYNEIKHCPKTQQSRKARYSFPCGYHTNSSDRVSKPYYKPGEISNEMQIDLHDSETLKLIKVSFSHSWLLNGNVWVVRMIATRFTFADSWTELDNEATIHCTIPFSCQVQKLFIFGFMSFFSLLCSVQKKRIRIAKPLHWQLHAFSSKHFIDGKGNDICWFSFLF